MSAKFGSATDEETGGGMKLLPLAALTAWKGHRYN